jgi:hypothetical protein
LLRCFFFCCCLLRALAAGLLRLVSCRKGSNYARH